MIAEGQRRLNRVLLAIALAVPLGLSVWWLASRREPTPSSFDEALDRALLPVMQQRDVQTKLGAATPRQARLLARELAAGSIQYLAPRDLELWQSTRVRVARVSTAACAYLWKGGNPRYLGRAIAGLGDEALQAYTEMLARGLALRLERKLAPEPAQGAIQHGFAAAAALLPSEARAAFEVDVRRKDLSAARACELFLTLANGTEKLEPEARSDFLRALARELQPDPSE